MASCVQALVVVLLVCSASLAHGVTFSFSGTVDEDATSVDLFGDAVDVGDAVLVDISIELESNPSGLDLIPIIPGSSGSAVLYSVENRGTARVEIGSLAYTCELINIIITDGFTSPEVTTERDSWNITMSNGSSLTGGNGDCTDVSFSVALVGDNTDVLTSTDFFLPNTLSGYMATFTASELQIDQNTNTIATVEAATGSLGTLVEPRVSSDGSPVVYSAVARDMLDDWTGSDPLAGDLQSAQAVTYANGDIILSVTYAPGTFDPGSTSPTFLIDADQNVNTGAVGVDGSNNDGGLIGPDFSVSIYPLTDTENVRVTPFDEQGNVQTRIAYPTEIIARSDGWDVKVQSSWIGNDDGLFTFTVLTQRQKEELRFTGIADYLPDFGLVRPQTSTGLVSAVLPNGRSVENQNVATVFGTAINTGPNPALACFVALATPIDAAFSYQTADPVTNEVTGTANTPVDIAPGASQSFVLSISPNSPFPPQTVSFRFECENYLSAAVTSGVNTLVLSSSTDPVPDVVALSSTPNNDGLVALADTENFGFFALASVNVGSSGTVFVSANSGTNELPIEFLVCQTDPGTGACINPTEPTASPVELVIAANETPTFSVFVKALSAIPFAPAINRIFVEFLDANGIQRGATSVAVQAQAGSAITLDFVTQTPGTLADTAGQGTGFLNRLPGTGSSLQQNDSNLELDLAAGVLRISSTAADLNGQAGLDEAEFLGIRLSDIGFTGAEDFEVSGVFQNIQYRDFVDQFGLYIGSDSQTALRAGYIHFGGTDARLFSVHTAGGLDSNFSSAIGPDAGSDIEVVITRIGGVFAVTVDGVEIPLIQPPFLNNLTDLSVGVFAANPGNGNSKIATLDRFSARLLTP